MGVGKSTDVARETLLDLEIPLKIAVRVRISERINLGISSAATRDFSIVVLSSSQGKCPRVLYAE